jgi:hypothetical protein
MPFPLFDDGFLIPVAASIIAAAAVYFCCGRPIRNSRRFQIVISIVIAVGSTPMVISYWNTGEIRNKHFFIVPWIRWFPRDIFIGIPEAIFKQGQNPISVIKWAFFQDVLPFVLTVLLIYFTCSAVKFLISKHGKPAA